MVDIQLDDLQEVLPKLIWPLETEATKQEDVALARLGCWASGLHVSKLFTGGSSPNRLSDYFHEEDAF